MTLALSGCVNLKHIYEYALNASVGVKKINEVEYDFTQHCRDQCQLAAIDSFRIYRKLNCPCDVYERADSVVLILNKTIVAYFSSLSELSKTDLTRYRIDPLKKALKEEDLKIFQIKKEEVNAYTQLGEVFLRAFADSFRQRQIKEYIRSANPSLQIVLSKLQLIESNLAELLEFRKETLFEQYNVLLKGRGLSDYEKQRAATEYYQALGEIQTFQKQIIVYARSLRLISGGHQKIAENLDHISTGDMRRSLVSYSIEIQDLISEFNKLRH